MLTKDVIKMMPTIAAYMKTAVGATNNAAWMLCLDAADKVKTHPNYRQNCKRNFRAALEGFHRYERRLLHANVNRLFHVADLPGDARAQYGDITDRDYYEMWVAQGGAAYEASKPFITSLWNKYRLALTAHGAQHPDLVAWAMVAQAVLELAVRCYKSGIRGTHQAWAINARGSKLPWGISTDSMNEVFGQLSLEPVAKLWKTALFSLDPKAMEHELTDIEINNIRYGVLDLEKQFMRPDVIIGSSYVAMKDYAENFANKEAHRQALKNVLEIKKDFAKEMCDGQDY